MTNKLYLTSSQIYGNKMNTLVMIKFYLLGFFLILRISTEVVNNVIHYNPLNNLLFSLNFYNQVFKHKIDFPYS